MPINPDYRAGEIAYLLDHSELDLVLTLAGRTHHLTLALEQAGHRPPVVVAEEAWLRVYAVDLDHPAARLGDC